MLAVGATDRVVLRRISNGETFLILGPVCKHAKAAMRSAISGGESEQG